MCDLHLLFLHVTDVSKDRGDFTEVDLSDDLCAIATYVDLSFNSLTSLWGLGRFTRLQILILDNNDLGDDIELPQLPTLHELSLNKNNIVSLDGLLGKITSCTPDIVYLSLLGNPACPTEMENSSYTEKDYHEYRWKVTDRLPKLRFLDSSSVLQRGSCHHVTAKQVGPLDMELIEELFPTTAFTRRKTTRSSGSDLSSSTSFGRLRFSYRGKHSEGNRFIRDGDL